MRTEQNTTVRKRLMNEIIPWMRRAAVSRDRVRSREPMTVTPEQNLSLKPPENPTDSARARRVRSDASGARARQPIRSAAIKLVNWEINKTKIPHVDTSVKFTLTLSAINVKLIYLFS